MPRKEVPFQQQFFTIRQVAAMTGLGVAGIKAQVFRGSIPSVRVGKRVLIAWSEVMKLTERTP